ncbi:MAG: class I SAM-dependent methyltransferase, partial [Clostridia bacterium]|nr:class I SAM-dependent methyltransferase [Clostridia bacterium]
MNWSPVNTYLAGLGLPELPREAAERFEIYARRLIEENEKYNLTAVTDPDEVAVRHFADSLTPAAYLPQDARRLIDVGCGAGFPGLPLKI